MEAVIALEGYDDLFSDFDIRSYGERAISRDFLDELRLRLRKAGDGAKVDIVFLIPSPARDGAEEDLIIERLSVFFAERRAHHLREDVRARRNSLLFVAMGLALSLAANFLVERLGFWPLFRDFVLIPAWFFVWNGLDLFFKNRREVGRQKDYYATLASSRIVFRNVEDYGSEKAR
jgi:hypothetical protein